MKRRKLKEDEEFIRNLMFSYGNPNETLPPELLERVAEEKQRLDKLEEEKKKRRRRG